MFAIVDIAGQQFKVEKEQEIFVHRLDGDVDSEVSFNKVLLIDNKGKVAVGNPIIQGASISARILEHLKGDKVIVFKKKRRKGYKKTQGHRQYLTKIQIEKIEEKATGKKAADKKKSAKTGPKSKIAAKTSVKTKAKATTKKATATKKPTAKKATKSATKKTVSKKSPK